MVTRVGSPEIDETNSEQERTRVERIYARYRASGRKQRAWTLENPGNAAIRTELLHRALGHSGQALGGSGLVLDVGCGTGWWLEELARRDVGARRLVGIDIQESRVRSAQARVPNAYVITADARNLPVPPQSCDLVTMFTVLSSLGTREDIADALAGARAALTNHGVLLIYEPRVPNLLNRRTSWISNRVLDHAGLVPRRAESLTVVPLVARRLGASTALVYPRLSRSGLVTHRLVSYRRASGGDAARPVAHL